jgi:cytochrome c oxidase assembly protein subunit 15
MATVQLNHRLSAWLLLFSILALWVAIRRVNAPQAARRVSNLLLTMLGVQIALGIATLLLAVPTALAAAHQAGAVLLFTLALWTTHELRRAQSSS